MVWNGRVVEAIEIEKKFWKGGRAFMGLIFSIDNQGVKHVAAYVDKRNSSLGGAKGDVRTNRTGLGSWMESVVAVESWRAGELRMSSTVSHTDNVTKFWLRGLLGFAPTGLEWREMQATHAGGRLSTKMDRGGDE